MYTALASLTQQYSTTVAPSFSLLRVPGVLTTVASLFVLAVIAEDDKPAG